MKPISALLQLILLLMFSSIGWLSTISSAIPQSSGSTPKPNPSPSKPKPRQNSRSQVVRYNPPPIPQTVTGTPGGRVRGGAKRSMCPQVAIPLTALVPFTQEENSVTNVWGLTTEQFPTLWFYIPYSRDANYPTEFVLLDDKTKNPVYQAEISLPKQPGIISLSLPKTIAPLQLDGQYRWFFNVYCDGQQQSPPIYVEGLIVRKAISHTAIKQLESASPLQQVAIYAQNGFWYNALTKLTQLYQQNPQDTQLQQEWENLLNSVGLGNLATQLIVKNHGK
ncbi:MAG: DUF928 domain-containing protein [Nostocaceae cyanobacterium]|nr:DUF928 domain-containing protein [Nostocaceae cyanobacterium]